MVTMLLDGEELKVGEEDCEACWSGYPKRCECGGLVHAEFGDENYGGDYWLLRKCDSCGDDYCEKDGGVD